VSPNIRPRQAQYWALKASTKEISTCTQYEMPISMPEQALWRMHVARRHSPLYEACFV
jgi:hypothetical protein